ncbi:hypothetical protein AGDE_12607 [Angomonas deanei]|nr:hypothetical protein AGDE_12607 [Angomonas deanei]|eukprot:EPY23957.1 hypothetical protein AGDE_12607 [Angomonas deanei]
MFGFGSSSKTEEKKDGKHYFNPNAAVNLPVTIKQVEELNPLENKKLIPSFLIAVKRHVYFGDLDDKGLPHGVGLFLFGCEPLLFQYLQEKFDQRPDKKTPMRPEEEVLEVLSCNNEQFGDFTMYDRYGGCWVHGSFHGEGVLLCYANYTNQPIPLCVQNNPTSSPTAPSPTANLTLQMGPMLNHNKFSFKYQGNFHLGRPQGSAEIFYGKYYSEPLPVLEKNPAFFLSLLHRSKRPVRTLAILQRVAARWVVPSWEVSPTSPPSRPPQRPQWCPPSTRRP